jgi:hypothetical protein
MLVNLVLNQIVLVKPLAVLVYRAKIEDLRLQDLRHETTSRLFEKGFTPMQVTTIAEHKNLKMLNRCTHLRAEDLVGKRG